MTTPTLTTGIHGEDAELSCLPITSLEQLWTYMSKPPGWGRFTVTKAPRGGSFGNVPFGNYYCHVKEDQWRTDVERRLRNCRLGKEVVKTELLVCHDMMNGYLHDRFVNGSSTFHSYRFYRWSAVDIFVYFSHHFVTIPPLGWINAAHKHGVNIFGTFITEWDSGQQICEAILSTPHTMNLTIQSLVQITKYFKLDGWLLNIENNLPDGNKMIEFVQNLTAALHSELPGARVIWYDSVRVDGKLHWQNELNEYNKSFYDVCDGIFLNYTWKEHNLERSLTACGSGSAYKVFVGVDVFGRNQYGGGGFKTQLAIDMVHKYGFSTALFAPGWTHEAICKNIPQSGVLQQVVSTANNILNICRTSAIVQAGLNMSSTSQSSDTMSVTPLPEKNVANDQAHLDLFLAREDLFWSLIWRYYRTHEIVQLPFATSFCQGSGLYRNRKAEYISDQPWYDLNAQEIQPSIPFCPLRYDLETFLNPTNALSDLSVANIQSTSCLEYEFADSFNGGSCLRFTKLADDDLITRLFVTNLPIRKSAIVIVVTKKIFYGCLSILALAERPDGSTIKLTLGADDECDPFEEFNLPNVYSPDMRSSTYSVPSLTPFECITTSEATIKPSTGEQLKSALIYLLINYPQEYFYFSARNYWTTRYYVIPCSDVRIRDIAVKLTGPVDCTVLLGHLAIIPYE